MTLNEIQEMNRDELISYLEGWGFQCYDYETTDELRDDAIDNFKTEGG